MLRAAGVQVPAGAAPGRPRAGLRSGDPAAASPSVERDTFEAKAGQDYKSAAWHPHPRVSTAPSERSLTFNYFCASHSSQGPVGLRGSHVYGGWKFRHHPSTP